jgi:hypothetical protein
MVAPIKGSMKSMKLEQRSRELSDSEKRVENSLKKVKRKE